MKDDDYYQFIKDDLRDACKILREGGLILYPTDTIWGIGCDATNPAAVRRVYELKCREERRSMLVLIDTAAKLNICVGKVPDIAHKLMELANKPLTLIYPNARNVAENLLGDDGSLGIRITNERFSHDLCRRFRKPIVSTSANISGEEAPSSYCDISQDIRNGVEFIVHYRRDEIVKTRPSVIIKIGAGGVIDIIRG
jgi:L-threonylcarbamoyladenylate synthase